jgi:hypothetical protein
MPEERLVKILALMPEERLVKILAPAWGKM